MKFFEDDINFVQIIKLVIMSTAGLWVMLKIMEIIELLKVIINK